MTSLIPSAAGKAEVKRSGSTPGTRPVIPPPPPPPGSNKLQTEREPIAMKSNAILAHDETDKSSNKPAENVTQNPCKNGNLTIGITNCDNHTTQIKTGSNSELKLRSHSSSSTESGGKSPRSTFGKSRPAPLPPKPSAEKVKNGSAKNANTTIVPLNYSSGVTNSNHGEVNGCEAALDYNSDSSTSISSSKEQALRCKLIVKPACPPPMPPNNTQASLIGKQSVVSSQEKLETVQLCKPAILLPKPKLKPCSPPPPPPNMDASLHESSRPATKCTEMSGPQSKLTENVKTTQHANQISDVSDIMKDVLEVIDRHDVTVPQTNNSPDNIALNKTTHSEANELTSESLPEVRQYMSTNNAIGSQLKRCSEVVQSSELNPSECSDNKQDADKTKETLNLATQLTVEIPETPAEQQSTPFIQKPSLAHRGPNSPRRRVKRRKTALGLMLCCGLGRKFLREKHSPPFELPLRTEGTLPRGNNLVNSTSLTSDLMKVSHSPKQLEQSDVIASHSPQQLEQNDVIASHSPKQLEQSDVIANKNQVSAENTDITTNGSDVNYVTICDEASVNNNGDISVNNKNSVKRENATPRDIIDVLCESEKPISLSKLQGDNKYLVVASESASSSQTNIDVTTRPVVHGVKLVKAEKGTTFLSFASQDISTRPTTPRLNKPTVKICEKSAKNSFGQTSVSQESALNNASTENLQTSVSSEVCDVKLRKDSRSRLSSREAEKVRSQSMEDLSCVIVDLDLDLANHIKRTEGYRSSFIGEDVKSKPALTRPPGEVQTLLKHSKDDSDKVYALPQPACYGDNTLRAVKLITDKYDTLERWKIRAVSFRGDGTVRKHSQNINTKISSPVRQISNDSKDADVICEVAEHDVIDSGVNMTSDLNNDSIVDTSYGNMLIRTGMEVKTCELTPLEISRIKLFYSSRDTEVTLANSVVDLKLSAKEAQKASDVKEWTHAQTGVPVLVLNTGQGRRRRELAIILADRDTSFPLWKDAINYLSQYEALTTNMHTMHLSSTLMKIAAFQFHSDVLAEDFMKKFVEITQDPKDDLWKVSLDPKKCSKKKRQVSKLPMKGDISQPIQFDHVTAVTPHDQNLAVTLGEFIPKSVSKNITNFGEDFRHRAYSG